MVVAAVLCLGAAFATAATGLWLLTRATTGDPIRQALRAVAPTQLAAAAMLAAAGVVALAAEPDPGVVIVAVCVAGAIGTVAAGCWQSAKVVAAAARPESSCTGSCAACVLSCR